MNKEQKSAKEFLQAYSVVRRQAMKAFDDYLECQASATKITATLDDSGSCGSPSGDKVANGAMNLLEHAEQLHVESEELTILYKKRNDVIQCVASQNWLWGEVLQCFFVEGMSMEEIRRYLERDRAHPYARSSVYRLFERALEKAYDSMVKLGYAH